MIPGQVASVKLIATIEAPVIVAPKQCRLQSGGVKLSKTLPSRATIGCKVI